MLYVRLVCSDSRCAELFEAYGSLIQLEALACDCGCLLEIVGWLGEVAGEEPDPAVVALTA